MATTNKKQDQEEYILAYSNSMSNDAAKATFDKFLNDNKGTGDIKDISKIVLTIEKIKNPDRVFGGLQNAYKVMLGDESGNTLLVTDANKNTNRINPNKVFFMTEKVRVVNSMPVNPKGFEGRDVEKIFKIFKGISNKEKKRVNRVVKYATDNNEDIVQLALKIYNSLEYSDIEQFLSVVEIVGFEVLSGLKNLDDMMNDIRTNYNEFIDNIRIDITIAKKIASQRDVNFRDPLKAVNHYRKHGHEFVSKVNGQSIENYLDILPNQLITDNNLVEMTTNQDGTITKTYNTPDNWYAEVVESVDSRIIRTMHINLRKPESYDKT